MKAVIINKFEKDWVTSSNQISSVVLYSNDGVVTQDGDGEYIYYTLKANEIYWVSHQHDLRKINKEITFFSPNGNNIEFLDETKGQV